MQFLSMKLAAVNPRLDIDVDNFFNKDVRGIISRNYSILQSESVFLFHFFFLQIFATSTSNFPTVGAGTSSEMLSMAQRQFNSLQQIVSSSGLEMSVLNLSEMALRRTASTPVSMPEIFLDSSSINVIT